MFGKMVSAPLLVVPLISARIPLISTSVSARWQAILLPRVMLHVGTRRHISAYVGMSTCADTCQHTYKVQMVGI